MTNLGWPGRGKTFSHWEMGFPPAELALGFLRLPSSEDEKDCTMGITAAKADEKSQQVAVEALWQVGCIIEMRLAEWKN